MWKTLSVEDPHEGHAPPPRLAAMPIGTNAAKSETGTKDCLEDVQAVDDHELPEEQQDEHDQRGDRHLELIRPRVHAQERRPHLWRRDVLEAFVQEERLSASSRTSPSESRAPPALGGLSRLVISPQGLSRAGALPADM